MAAIYHPGVVAIVPHYDLGHPTNAVNVTYWQTTATGLTTAQLTAMYVAFNTAWGPGWASLGSSTNHYTGCWVIDMSSNLGLQVTNTGFTPTVGTQAATSAPDNTALLLSLKTAMRYRGGHGRLYIPGISTAQFASDGQTLAGSTKGNCETMWNNTAAAMAALAGSSGGPLLPIVWHKKLLSAPNTVEPILSVACSTTLATQRRRLRKVPHH